MIIMQRFRDTATDTFYEFDPDVKVVEEDGVYTFFTREDVLLDQVPATLVPEPIEPDPAP